MLATVTGALRPLYGVARALLVMLAMLALLLTTSIAAPHVRAATPLKAVLIVGPTSLDSQNLPDADNVAAAATSHGMNVIKVYTPHATWAAVLNAIQGANFVVYWGHGNGWPSPYPPFQEQSKDGFGLNSSDGSTSVTYYGGNFIRSSVRLAPNAVVGLSHACYTSGNGEPGQAIPDWTTAVQRVDNFAAAFLAVGATNVFALQTGSFTYVVNDLFSFDPTKTMDDIFRTPGSGGLAYYGYVGWDDRYFDSVRMPGNKNELDPEQTAGFRRAITGTLTTTITDWMAGAGYVPPPKPTVTAPRASFVGNTTSRSMVTLQLAWDASPSPNVVKYDLQYSENSGTWYSITLASPTALSVNKSFYTGNNYRFRLRATDSAGTVGDWVTTVNRWLGRLQETSTSLVYSGTTWSGDLYLSGASASYVKKATSSGSNVSYSFTGNWVGFVTTLGPSRGKAAVYLDGTLVATLDLYSPTTTTARLAWVSQVTSGTTHTVQVRTLGTRNAASTSTRVDVDAFVYWR